MSIVQLTRYMSRKTTQRKYNALINELNTYRRQLNNKRSSPTILMLLTNKNAPVRYSLTICEEKTKDYEPITLLPT